METLSATTIFWLIALGSITGWLVGYLMGREGKTKYSNALWGIFGALSIGIVALLVGLSGVLLYAFMGTLATLFIANVFHEHHKEDRSGNIDRGISVHRYHRNANHK